MADLLKASALSEQQLYKSAKRLVASRLKASEDEATMLSNLHVYLKLNGTGAASRLCNRCGIVKARLSELVNGKRGVPVDMARRIAGVR